jgi:hypothetical protein
MFLESKTRPLRKTDNLTAICEPIVYTMWEPSRPVTGMALLFFFLHSSVKFTFALLFQYINYYSLKGKLVTLPTPVVRIPAVGVRNPLKEMVYRLICFNVIKNLLNWLLTLQAWPLYDQKKTLFQDTNTSCSGQRQCFRICTFRTRGFSTRKDAECWSSPYRPTLRNLSLTCGTLQTCRRHKTKFRLKKKPCDNLHSHK